MASTTTTRRQFLTQVSGAALAVAVPACTGRPPAATPRAPGLVPTVLGPIGADRLGFTLPHEHVFAGSTGILRTWPELFGGRARLADQAVDRLKALKDEGVDTIVDVTTVDVGRDIRLLEDVSRRSGLQIVACTGHWLDPSMSMNARTADELAEFFVLEIERGIEDTGIRPGVIKVASDRAGATAFLEKSLRAAARASKATGVPVTTHSFAAGRGGEQQAELFESEGLDPGKVCLGHSDETDDLGYLGGLARRGYTIGMDHLPVGVRTAPGLLPWQRRAETLKQLVDAGFVERIFLSNDWFFGLSIAGTGAMATLDTINPDGMLFNVRKTIPYLRELGVTEDEIRTITVDNPRRFFGGSS